ncbi:ABC transporter ATP-binding protein [Dactylosporangium sp. CA-092794]|uniref:ABC transporter ATP-binding protein n=1 Tax=Dactylosporangium sp. CA-092794 TaxID=3239929 RepID=UPI003D920AAB
MSTATTTVEAPPRAGILRRGLALSPELFTGLAGTLGLAVLATAGRVAVPVAIQQGIDRGIRAPGGPDLGVLTEIVAVTAGVLMVTMVCSYLMNVRLFIVSETALAGIRARTFRHIHDLSMLHQQSERRGALVSRVTSDVDQISQFLQFGGLLFVVNLGQLLVTTVVMLVYSWQLTLVVFAAFAPLAFVVRFFQRRLSVLYLEVRESVGAMLGVIAESVVGAPVVRAYGIQHRTGERLDASIERSRRSQFRAQTNNVISMSFGELAAGLALGGVVIVGTLVGIGGHLSVGRLTAFLFLATLFVQPVQVATEVLNEAQNAIAGWRRVLDVVETEPDVADPGPAGRALPDGPIGVRFEHVHFAYPDGPEVLTDVDLTVAARTRVAVVGETGSGKTTFAKLLTRLMDPSTGRVLLSGVPLPDVRFDSLRSRVVMVPQDGFLFDASIADNVRFARPTLTDADLHRAFTELGLADWLDALPDGLHTHVGERGEALSVGERQLVALARAYVADPDLLVLDEATSAVDPATEVRLQRTLDAVTRGRTTIAIAHRLSTAQSADEVIVVDHGRIVQRGPHSTLLTQPTSIYARLYASWLEQTR